LIISAFENFYNLSKLLIISNLTLQTFNFMAFYTELIIAKNNHKATVERVLKSVVHITQWHHPEDYMQVLRVFGFQKEKY